MSTAGRTTLILMALDANFPVLVLAGYGLLRHGNPAAMFLAYPWLLLTAVAFPVTLGVTELYNPRCFWGFPKVPHRVVAATLAVVALFGAAYYFVGDRVELPGLFLLLAIAMATEALAVRAVVAFKVRGERTVRTALVVGAGWAGRAVVDCTLREPRLRVKVAGIVDDDPLKRNVEYKGVAVVGTGQTLLEAVERSGANLVITAISYTQNAELIKSLLRLKMRGVEVVDMPSFVERATGQIPIKNVEDSWFLYSGGFELLHRPWLQRFKRLVDVVSATAGLLLSLPLLGIVALLIKLDSRGPVFFRQERTGQGEKPFQLVKFRSMREDAEQASGPVWAGVRDYRVTRVGRWLRLTRLDEIPQFINVLKGEMSFIGPRPERPFFVERLSREIPYYGLRFAVKPGLTGWAQVQFRYGASVEDAMEKLKYDLYYIKNMSWRLDLFIAFKTLKVVFFAQGN
ncbi:MAG TPA: TIGR03013 family XrtA/PEP-CTERM system glycosyltransferase [Candidatus Methanoperedens sp.]|nr:TIGR03013 family XrtA/PEP-CTERM system glycosyltransferase [Candidatus Methanoperedens sp.]